MEASKVAIVLSLFALVQCTVFAAPIGHKAGFLSRPWGEHIVADSLNVTGTLPSWLNGSLFRNGPGRWVKPLVGTPYWFDGLAMLHAFHFHPPSRANTPTTVSYTNQFVMSDTYNKSAPSVSTAKRDSNSTPGSPNTCVCLRKVGNHYLSNTGAAASNEFDPKTLDTKAAPFVYDDTLPYETAAPSHAQTDPLGNVVHFQVDIIKKKTYDFYEIPAGSTSRRSLASIKPMQKSPSFMHSFGLSENYIVLAEQPCSYGLPGGIGWLLFAWDQSSPTYWRVIDRHTGKEVKTFQTNPPFFTWHFINTYENKTDNTLVVDLPATPNNTVMHDFFINLLSETPAKGLEMSLLSLPMRFVLPLDKPSGTEVTPRLLTKDNVLLPTIFYEKHNTQPYRYFYGFHVLGPHSNFFDSMIKVDTVTGQSKVWSAPHTYPGEGIFVPSPGAQAEDDGIVLSLVLDGSGDEGVSFLLVLNATTFEEEARVHLPIAVPFGFHGRFYKVD